MKTPKRIVSTHKHCGGNCSDVPLSILRFYRDKNRPDGHSDMCRTCWRKRQDATTAANGGLTGTERLK